MHCNLIILFELIKLRACVHISALYFQQTCSTVAVLLDFGPRSRPTVLSKTSIMKEKSDLVKAASQRPFEDPSRMKACCA